MREEREEKSGADHGERRRDERKRNGAVCGRREEREEKSGAHRRRLFHISFFPSSPYSSLLSILSSPLSSSSSLLSFISYFPWSAPIDEVITRQ
jgi:hypothetical protein